MVHICVTVNIHNATYIIWTTIQYMFYNCSGFDHRRTCISWCRYVNIEWSTRSCHTWPTLSPGRRQRQFPPGNWRHSSALRRHLKQHLWASTFSANNNKMVNASIRQIVAVLIFTWSLKQDAYVTTLKHLLQQIVSFNHVFRHVSTKTVHIFLLQYNSRF